MKRVDRLWIQAIDQAVDDKLINFLVSLKAINKDVWRSYMESSHIRLIEHRQEKANRQSRSETRQQSYHPTAPNSIKPTRQRKF